MTTPNRPIEIGPAIKRKTMTDAPQTKQAAEALNFEFVDLPQLAETYADSIQTLFFDGQNLRVVFCASRLEEPKGGGRPLGKRYPTCRLVLSAQGTLDLINRIQKISAALARDGAEPSRYVPNDTNVARRWRHQ
jgi:hypothetical protein